MSNVPTNYGTKTHDGNCKMMSFETNGLYTGHHPSKKEIINWTKREDYPPKAKNGSHSLLSDGMSSHACTSKLAILKGTSNG